MYNVQKKRIKSIANYMQAFFVWFTEIDKIDKK